MAIDMDKNGKLDWQEVVNAFIAKGFEWGGNWRTFKDYPHCQKTFGKKWQDLSVLYQQKKFIKDCMYVNV